MITGRLNMVLGLVAMIQAAINGKLLGEPAAQQQHQRTALRAAS